MNSPILPAQLQAVVLVADDEDMVREYMARILRDAGHHVVVAHDGLDAWGIIEGYAGALHLVITDLTMPRMTGMELATRIKQWWPSLPVLYVTGGKVPEDGPAFPLLKKPFTPDALAAQAQALLAPLPRCPAAPQIERELGQLPLPCHVVRATRSRESGKRGHRLGPFYENYGPDTILA